jgi:hypothetical protein
MSRSYLLPLLLLAACKTTPVPQESADAAVVDVAADADLNGADAVDSPDVPAILPLPALVTCTSATICESTVGQKQLFATWRADRWLADADYPEYTKPSGDGVRMHIAGIAQASGLVTRVVIGEKDAVQWQGTTPGIEWLHVWPHEAVAGQPIWLAYHTLAPALGKDSIQLKVRIEAGQTTVLDGVIASNPAAVPLTWVTTRAGQKQVLLHLRNDDKVPHTLAKIWLNGIDVTAQTCAAVRTLQQGEATLWTVPLCTPLALGSAWTLAVEWADAVPSVGVGRVLPERFPIEYWPSSDDCAAPGSPNDGNFQKHLDAHFDTGFLYWGTNSKCGWNVADIVGKLAPPGWQALIADDFPIDQPGLFDVNAAVAGFLIGDEVDGEIYAKDGHPNAADQAKKTAALWDHYPFWPVYQGAKTNGNVGVFAGAADIQGIDFYIAACAPHITEYGSPARVRGAYDYLRNARDNHMPLTTWFYAQGIHSGWDWGDGATTVHMQPSPAEIAIQVASVLAAGGKGLMWFQSTLALATAVPETWQAMADWNAVVHQLAPWLREGDVTGAVTSSDPRLLAEAIRGPDAIVVPVLHVGAIDPPDDVSCLQAKFGTIAPPHWHFPAVTATLTVSIPADLAVTRVQEIQPQGPVDVAVTLDLQARSVTLPVALDEAHAARVFVLR